MVQITKDQVVYNAGSNLEVSCVYQNTTITGWLGGSGPGGKAASAKTPEERRRLDVLRIIQNSRLGEVHKDALVWLHNGKKFSHRNRRRYIYSRVFRFCEILPNLIIRTGKCLKCNCILESCVLKNMLAGWP